MLPPEERALLTETQDRLIDLLVQQDEAKTADDWDRVRELKAEINDVKDELEQISRSEVL